MRKLFTVIGASNTSLTTYMFNEHNKYESAFCVKAILEKEKKHEYLVYIFATNEAKDMNGEKIQQELSRCNNAKIEIVDIPNIKSKKDLDILRSIIYSKLDIEDNIYLDITNGFRFQPMFILTILNYAKVMKNISIEKIWYGNYEGRDQENNITQVLDLTQFNEMFEWAFAFDSYNKYGFTAPIEALKNKKIGTVNGKDNKSKVKNAIDNLDHFTNGIIYGRGRHSEILKKDESIKSAYLSLQESLLQIEKIDEEDLNEIAPIKELLDITKETIDKMNFDNNTNMGISIVNWCMEKGLIHQAFVGLIETMISYTIENSDEYRGKVDSGDFKIRREVKNKINQGELPNIKPIVKDRSELITFGKIFEDANFYRNSISHFGYTTKGKDYDYKEMGVNLKKSYKYFLEIIQKGK